MEADWEVEVGSGAPVINASWEGFVDLRLNPERAHALPEAVQFSALADALIALNRRASPVWTAKCDVWLLEDLSDIDPYEMECGPDAALHGWACYVDLLAGSVRQWTTAETAVQFCKYLCTQLQTLPLTCCRADLVVRSAMVAGDHLDVGITVYLTACGATSGQAKQLLQTALVAFVDAVSPTQR
jgi:hypothetical protein